MGNYERCGIVIPIYPGNNNCERSISEIVSEAVGLAQSIDLHVAFIATQTIKAKRPATIFGTGKIAELADKITIEDVRLVIVNDALTPIQQRNLEKTWNCKVIDRTALILEIFGKRARTKEGRLQVELAALNYQKSRLVRSWTHLERQRGGAGFMGGPGETQIESDRRMINERITKLKKQLQQVTKTRRLHRKKRNKVPYPIIALVGYTNAGKSTLFNKLTGANIYAENKLFATLDPTMRAIILPSGIKAILSDTVGFVSNLPHELVAAFRATLEEVIEADLILHIRDIAHQDSEAQKQDVINILQQLLNSSDIDNKLLEIHNKIDLVQHNNHEHNATYNTHNICISALTGAGLEHLLLATDEKLQEITGYKIRNIKLAISAGKQLAWLHNNAKIISQRHEHEFVYLQIKIRDEDWGKFTKLTKQ